MKSAEVWLKVSIDGNGDLAVSGASVGKPKYGTCGGNERFLIFDLEIDESMFQPQIETGLTIQVARGDSVDASQAKTRLLGTMKDLAS